MSTALAPPPAVRWADISKADMVFDNTIGGYWNANASTVRQMLAERKGLPVSIHMDSPGGYAYDGLAIHEMLRNHAAEAPVSIYIYGKCMSAASIVAMAASPGKLFAAPSAQLMIHKARGGAYGNAVDLQSTAESLANIDEAMLEIYRRRTGLTEDKLRAVMTEAGTFMGTAQALELKLIDAIVEPPTALATLFTPTDVGTPPAHERVGQPNLPTVQASGTPPDVLTPVTPTTTQTPSKMDKELLALLGLPATATLAEATRKIKGLKRKGAAEVVSKLAESGALGAMPKAYQPAFNDLVRRKPLDALAMLTGNAEAQAEAGTDSDTATEAKPKAEAPKAKPEATLKKLQAADFSSILAALGGQPGAEAKPKTYKEMSAAEIKAMEKADPTGLENLIRAELTPAR